ncbi:hypothetical protein CCMA1212_002183 [Trichoderma ghanense]|uniref:Flo11 n=1 Tax=Trichoderma ghanense TaxID=65468 RepID=A0ABY2HBM2_9HYPO
MTGSAVESRPASSVNSSRQVRSQSISSDRPARQSRSLSISSDRPSTASHSFFAPPLSVSPEAAFIASTAASQIITNDHDGQRDLWYDQHGVEPSREAALISPAALQLVNGFLDQLLLNFLQVARSTALSALRPAVSDVLKPKLAKETITNADEELKEYIGGSEDEEYTDPQSPNGRDWDVELAWKRARLRCMVYSSLGDLEEDDEDKYMKQEHLEVGEHEQSSDIISPAVAIFLTSVLEYIGELTLTVAGQAAGQRMRSKLERELKDGTRSPAALVERIVVEDVDMERVALDRTLGRLWRGWKKRLRAPVVEFAPGRSPHISHMITDGLANGLDDRRKSRTNEDEASPTEVREQPESALVEDILPMNIPLPMGDNDIAEIEVPGLAHYSDEEEEDEAEEDDLDARRVKSFSGVTSLLENSLASESGHYATLLGFHRRSTSLPTRGSVFYATARPSSKPLEAESDAAQPKEAEATPENPDSSFKKGRDSEDSGSDDLDEFVYEKAEILTSSRVSVSSSSSRSASDSGKVLHLSRSSSVRSARLIDVPPRSPVTTRPPSQELAERPRAKTVSGSSPLSRAGGTDELRAAKALDTSLRTVVSVAAARSPVERTRPAIRNAETISESDEDTDRVSTTITPISSSRTRDQLGRLPHGLQTNMRTADRSLPAVQSDQSHHGARGELLRATKSATDTQFSDIPYRTAAYPSRQSPRPTAEQTVPEESEEAASPRSSGIPPRPIHTSNSSTSSIPGRFKAVRTISDDASSRAESMARTFEELIQSNQTITYTLTPENMRDIDVPTPHESPVVTKTTRKSEDLMRPSPTPSNASPSNSRTQPPSQKAPTENKPKLSGPIPRAPPGATSLSGRIGGSQARDARAPGESLSDFADFLKSTGPPGDRAPAALRNAHNPVTSTKGFMESQQSISTMASRNNNRSRYQPREAAATSRNDNSDLIDFIRQGPPIPGSQNHIPRHVAPFRNTMDSEMMSGAGGGRAVDAVLPDMRHSQASTDNSMPSVQSSINSSSALLKNQGRSKMSKMFGEEEEDDDMVMPMPVRKTRRVRDPYAIDFSDEDEDEDDFDLAPRPPAKKEESLAEFLLNCEPPPAPPPPPASSAKMPKKRTSTPSLIGRFTRSGSKETNTLIDSRSISSRAGAMGFTNDVRSLNSRVGPASKHVPIQMPPGYDKYGPISANPPPVSNASMDRPPPVRKVSIERPPTVGRVTMKRFEPREPASLGETADLARFLRESEPPPEFVPPKTASQQDEPSGFSKMFGRRRKASVA